jgi:hypothetical protein
MVELRGHLGLAQKSGPDLGAEGELRWKDLDRDLPLQPPVARPVHDTHAAAPDFAVELVCRLEDALDMSSKVRVGWRSGWLWHAVGLTGYDK